MKTVISSEVSVRPAKREPTMLRLTVLLLLLANAAYFAWSQGLLAPWGFAPAQQSEPQRLAQQIKPQALAVLSREEAGRLEVSRGRERVQAAAGMPAGRRCSRTRSWPA